MTPLKQLPLLALIAACTIPETPPAPGQMQLTGASPEGAPPGTCWARTVTPAVIETVEKDVLVQPAQIGPDGQIQAPPVYRRETRREIVQPRDEEWFQVPCSSDLTPDFVASVQRALAARGHYAGPPTGQLDGLTRAAIRRYQAADDGPNSDILTVASARALGLWTVTLSAAEG